MQPEKRAKQTHQKPKRTIMTFASILSEAEETSKGFFSEDDYQAKLDAAEQDDLAREPDEPLFIFHQQETDTARDKRAYRKRPSFI